MRYLFKAASVVILLLALTSCNTVKIGYNNAQNLAYWWLNSYISFNTAQKTVIKAELQTLHDWHRFNELPVYTKMLRSIEHKLAHDISSKQACEVAESVRERFRVLNLQFEPIIERIAPSLSEEQIAHIEQQFENKNAEWREDWLEGTQEKRDKRRLKLAIKRAEMFYGRLNDTQRDILKNNIRTSTFDPDISYAEKLRRQKDAIATLRKIIDKKLDEPDIKLEIAAYFDRFHHGDDAAYQNYMDRLTVDACAGFAKLHNSTNSEQRQHLAKKLAGYIKDLEALKTSAQLNQ